MASLSLQPATVLRRNTLDINWAVERVVNHSSQKYRRSHLNFSARRTLLPRRKLQRWRDRWLMGHGATTMSRSVNINASRFTNIVTLQSKDSNHKSSIIGKQSMITGLIIWITCISPHDKMFNLALNRPCDRGATSAQNSNQLIGSCWIWNPGTLQLLHLSQQH